MQPKYADATRQIPLDRRRRIFASKGLDGHGVAQSSAAMLLLFGLGFTLFGLGTACPAHEVLAQCQVEQSGWVVQQDCLLGGAEPKIIQSPSITVPFGNLDEEMLTFAGWFDLGWFPVSIEGGIFCTCMCGLH